MEVLFGRRTVDSTLLSWTLLCPRAFLLPIHVVFAKSTAGSGEDYEDVYMLTSWYEPERSMLRRIACYGPNTNGEGEKPLDFGRLFDFSIDTRPSLGLHTDFGGTRSVGLALYIESWEGRLVLGWP